MSGQLEISAEDVADLARALGRMTAITEDTGIQLCVYGPVQIGKADWNLPISVSYEPGRGYYIDERVGS